MSGTQNHLPFFTPGRNVGLERPAVVETNDTGASSLSERIELLDEETRSCWRRVDELEDEEASLNHRLMRLEKIRRGERLEILALEQACKAAEMAMIQAQEEGANFDAKAQVLESLAQDAAADAAAATDAASAAMESYQQGASATLSPTNGGGNAGVSGEQGKPPRLEGFTALSAVLKEMPAHDEKREHLASMLHQTEIQTQSEIAEASRSAAELRLSIKRKDAERFPLEHEITALREEQARMTSEDEVMNVKCG